MLGCARKGMKIYGYLKLTSFRKTGSTPKSTIFSRLLFFGILPLLSAGLLILSFPKFDMGWLSWVGLVPVLIATFGRSAIQSFFIALIFGITFFAGVFYWTLTVASYSLVHQIVLILYLGSYFGLFGLFYAFLTKRLSLITSLMAVPFLWVSLEYLRSNMGFLAHPWPLLGHAQSAYLSIIQVSDFTGVYGVSFTVAAVNALVTAFCCFLLYRSKKARLPVGLFISNRDLQVMAIATTGLLAVVLFYGIIRLSGPIEGKKLKISLVQGNIAQAHKWQPKYAKKIIDIYTELTRDVMQEKPDLIVWPEAATPKPISIDKIIYHHVKKLADEANAYIVLGSSSHEKFKLQENIKIKFRNSAFLLGPGKQIEDQRYDKIHLLPFGEYLPHKDIIPWSLIKIPNVATTLAGKTFTVFQTPDFRFSAPVCWETVFPYMIRNFVRNGAQFIVNITNEAWFGDTAAPYHFLSSNVFRAVENRTYLVRCGNTGVSCFIDPHGKIVSRVTDKHGKDIFLRGVLTDTITLMDTKTVYTRYGDWFALFCLGCSILLLIVGLFHEKRIYQAE